MNVVAIRPNHMTEAEYDAERAALGERKHATAKYDQSLATLFYRSGWTQEELAKKEGCSRPYIAQKLIFGRFLNDVAMATNPKTTPNNLSERKFRGYWSDTPKDGNERIRFQAVLDLMAGELTLAANHIPTGIEKAIKAKFADGKWHHLDEIVEAAGASEDAVKRSLQNISKKGKYPTKCEQKKVGTKLQYRIFSSNRTVNSIELATKLGPIIDSLKEEGKKHNARMSPGTVLTLAVQLQRLLDEWVK